MSARRDAPSNFEIVGLKILRARGREKGGTKKKSPGLLITNRSGNDYQTGDFCRCVDYWLHSTAKINSDVFEIETFLVIIGDRNYLYIIV